MKRLFPIGTLIILLMAFFIWAFMPPQVKLRKGKDLAGGVSMVYTVRVDPGEDAKSVIDRTIQVLKDRVDPQGLMEISMVAQGRDRIEITMPLPRPEVKQLRKAFEDSLAELGLARLTESRVEQALRLSHNQRAQALMRLEGGIPSRKPLLEAAATAFDKAESTRKTYDALADQGEKDAMVEAVATAELAYRNAKSALIATDLSAAEVSKVVQSSTQRRKVEDNETGQRVELPSPRELSQSQLLERHPDAKETIQKVLDQYDQYAKVRTTLDDPQDLIRLLRGAGVLSFRIAIAPGAHPEESRLRQELRTLGPKAVRSTDAKWFKINQIETWLRTKSQVDLLARNPDAASMILGSYVVEHYAGEYYILCSDARGSRLTKAEGEWTVAGAREGRDQRGRPAIDFQMDTAGGIKLGNLTREHIKQPMAILLDDEAITAPNLNSEITTNGQIEGDFPRSEIDYIVKVLGGGSLRAKLSSDPISISSVGPELGADNLEKGFRSGIISAIIVAVFMVGYYFVFGGVAVLALVANSICILGAMALSRAAFTMPGIAGVILTFGMAVDSNVLVYERIREEFNRGADMKTAVRLGFEKALSAIVDGNVTNLIVCVVLYYTGTPEIKGFAITMGIGVVATLFAAIYVSRFIFDVMLAMGWRKGSMLPMAIPQLQSWLTPNVDWLKYRYVFFAVSTIYVLLGLGMVYFQGQKMLDNEFKGGTQVTLQFRPDPNWRPDPANPAARPTRVTMDRADVEERVKAIGNKAAQGDRLRLLTSADVFPIDPQANGVTSDRFVIKTTAQADNPSAILDPIVQAFSDMIEVQPKLAFHGVDELRGVSAPVFPIDKETLGQCIGRADLRQDVRRYRGGVAVLLDGITPPTPVEMLRTRLDTVRQSSQFSDTLSRQRDIVVLGGTDEAVTSAAIIVFDETATISENEQRWETEVRDREWAIVQEGLAKQSTPASVQVFSPAIAATFRANATTATIVSFFLIGIYIWVRFKTPSYSIAAIVALVHDVLTVVGLVALAEILYENPSTHAFAQSALLLPFKIDLNLVAALLTIAGYSLNDTVVIMDRIRENKGKLPHATRDIINASINQTFSRTLITGGTTLFSCIVLYMIGGEGMRAFAFALATGLVVGTYSSIGVAAPIVWSRKHENQDHEAAQHA